MDEAYQCVKMFAEMYDRLGHESVYSLWLSKGRTMEALPLDNDEREYLATLCKQLGYSFFKPRQCWMNSQKLVLLDMGRRLTYCEGWWTGALQGMVFPHGWATINGKVVDMTAWALSRKYPDRKPPSYFGIEVPVKMVMEHQLDTGYYDGLMETPLWCERLLS